MSVDYKAARVAAGLSKQDVSAWAKRAGHVVSPHTLDRIEKGESARGLSDASLSYVQYLYGLTDADIQWTSVEKGAPVLVLGQKGDFKFISADDAGNLTVFGGERNKEKFRSFTPSQVRLVAPTALPAVEDASRFETRGRATSGIYGDKILSYMQSNPGAHAVGALAVNLGIDNAVVTRVTASLAKSGKLSKVGRGVFSLPQADVSEPAPAAASDAPGF